MQVGAHPQTTRPLSQPPVLTPPLLPPHTQLDPKSGKPDNSNARPARPTRRTAGGGGAGGARSAAATAEPPKLGGVYRGGNFTDLMTTFRKAVRERTKAAAMKASASNSSSRILAARSTTVAANSRRTKGYVRFEEGWLVKGPGPGVAAAQAAPPAVALPTGGGGGASGSPSASTTNGSGGGSRSSRIARMRAKTTGHSIEAGHSAAASTTGSGLDASPSTATATPKPSLDTRTLRAATTPAQAPPRGLAARYPDAHEAEVAVCYFGDHISQVRTLHAAVAAHATTPHAYTRMM